MEDYKITLFAFIISGSSAQSDVSILIRLLQAQCHNCATRLEQGRYFFFSDEEDIIHRIDIYNRINLENRVQVSEGDIIYLLYTRNNLHPKIINYYHIMHPQPSILDPNKDTVLIIHGWRNDQNSAVNKVLTEAFLQDSDVNLIVVDWSYLSKNILYTVVVNTVPEVGIYVGRFIKWLNRIGVSFDRIHVVGFSLGAHIAGNAGRETGGKIRRITGLDPAAPFFFSLSTTHLAKTDAQYVEVIHTNSRLFGVDYVCGHADFFPNGGRLMPECLFSLCSHSKSYYYMAETVKYNNMIGRKCKSMKHVKANNCTGFKYPMGNSDLSKNRTGLFRVNTLIKL